VKRSAPIKRTPLARGTKKIAQVSKKRAKVNAVRRRVIAEVLKTRCRCEAGHAICTVDRKHRCLYEAHDIHEPLTRARGGSITDPNNMIVVCRACHDWIHIHPDGATSIGLLVHSYNTEYDHGDEQTLDDSRHSSTLDNERRTHVALPQASKDREGDKREMVHTDKASTDTSTQSCLDSGHTVSSEQEMET